MTERETKESDHNVVRPRRLDPEEVREARKRTEEALERMRDARARLHKVLNRGMGE